VGSGRRRFVSRVLMRALGVTTRSRRPQLPVSEWRVRRFERSADADPDVQVLERRRPARKGGSRSRRRVRSSRPRASLASRTSGDEIRSAGAAGRLRAHTETTASLIVAQAIKELIIAFAALRAEATDPPNDGSSPEGERLGGARGQQIRGSWSPASMISGAWRRVPSGATPSAALQHCPPRPHAPGPVRACRGVTGRASGRESRPPHTLRSRRRVGSRPSISQAA